MLHRRLLSETVDWSHRNLLFDFPSIWTSTFRYRNFCVRIR